MNYFDAFINDCIAIANRKAPDYSKEGDRYSNFKFAAIISEQFTDPIDRVFATMIGIKIARLIELLNGKTPNNESIRDSFIDLTNYSALWGSYHDSLNEVDLFGKLNKTDVNKGITEQPATSAYPWYCLNCGRGHY